MSTKPVHYWDGEQVITMPYDTRELLREHLCVRTGMDSPQRRYGFYSYAGSGQWWTHVPFKDFPPRFRAHLLLLGG